MSYYAEKLKQGLDYESFVKAIIANELFIDIDFYKTYEDQINQGESKQGIEIKFNSEINKYNSIWIEIKERSRTDRPYNWSGIYRNDNTWLFVCGDYKQIYIMSKKYLRMLHKTIYLNKVKEISRHTSIGFRMMLPEVNKYCIKKIII